MRIDDPDELLLRRSLWFWGLALAMVGALVGRWVIEPRVAVETWDDMRVVDLADGRGRISPASALSYRYASGPRWGFRAMRSVNRTGLRITDRVEVVVFDRGWLDVPVPSELVTAEIADMLELDAAWVSAQSGDRWTTGPWVADGPRVGDFNAGFVIEAVRLHAWMPLVGLVVGAGGRLVLAFHRLHVGRARIRDGACPECGHMMHGASPCSECGALWRQRWLLAPEGVDDPAPPSSNSEPPGRAS